MQRDRNPFSATFSKIPSESYIQTEEASKIIENFSYEEPSESVYKITGVRGSGKTVMLAMVENEFSGKERTAEGWIVYQLSPARDMLKQLAVNILDDTGIRKKDQGFNLSLNVMGTGAGIGYSSSGDPSLLDYGIEIKRALRTMRSRGKKILIGVDEVSRTEAMVQFASEFGEWLREDLPIYLVCTGLYENIEQLCNVPNLTFFRRATTIQTRPLSMERMSEMYRSRLGIDSALGKTLAGMTMGYAYAFQLLGIQCFENKGEIAGDTDLWERLRSDLYAYAYEKIWEELSDQDREFVLLISDGQEHKREEIIPQMARPSNYSVYRDRLLRRGLILSIKHGYISLSLPFFGDYAREYGGIL